MNKRQLTLITLITIISLYSCKKELSDLGSDLIPSSQKFVFSTDTLKSIELNTVSNQPYCSFITYNDEIGLSSTMLIGSYNDSRFGNITSDCITEVYPSEISYSHYKRIKSIDSVVLCLTNTNILANGIKSYIGNQSEKISMNLSYLKDTIKKDSKYTLTQINDLKKGDPVSNFSFKHSENVRVSLPVGLGEKLIAFDVIQNQNDTKDTSMFNNHDNYRDYFRGIYIESEKLTTEGCLSKFSLVNSYIKVYCKELIKHPTIDKDTLVSLENKFSLILFGGKSFYPRNRNLIKRDFSTANFVAHIDKPENDTVTYASALNGPMIEISKDTLENWKKRILKSGTLDELTSSSNLNIAINSAELLIYAAPKDLTDIESIYREKTLKLVAVINDETKYYLCKSIFNADNGVYRFDITSFIHNYLRGQINPKKLIISTDFFDPNVSVELFNDKRAILYNNTSSKSPVILISYTKL